MVDDDLLNYLDTISQGEIYRVDAVLKETDLETTERVFLITANGSEQGPYIRKRIAQRSGLGKAYERIWEAQQSGKRFMHLPRMHAYDVMDGYRDVVMEYVEGLTLDEAVVTPDYSEQTAAVIAVLICDAVMELHEGFDPPLIHRDLKPSNVVVSPSNLSLLDFGISRTFDDNAMVDTRSFGTRGYAPPEQFGYGQTDERSDIYALGMLIAYCFLREDPSRALVESGFDDDRIPELLRDVLAKATAFDPRQRYESVRELRDSIGFEQLIAHVTEKGSGGSADANPSVAENSVPEEISYGPPQASEVVHSESPEPKPRIPRWLGTAWNVILIAAWALFSAAGVSLTFAPPPNEAMQSIFARAVGYLGISVAGLGFIAFALLDKRGLKKRLPTIVRQPGYRQTITCISIGVAVIFASAVLAVMIDQSLG